MIKLIQCSICKDTYSPRWHAKQTASATLVYCNSCYLESRRNANEPAALLHPGTIWAYKGVYYVIHTSVNYLYQINDEWKECVVYTIKGMRHGLRFVREREEFLAKFTYTGEVEQWLK